MKRRTLFKLLLAPLIAPLGNFVGNHNAGPTKWTIKWPPRTILSSEWVELASVDTKKVTFIEYWVSGHNWTRYMDKPPYVVIPLKDVEP